MVLAGLGLAVLILLAWFWSDNGKDAWPPAGPPAEALRIAPGYPYEGRLRQGEPAVLEIPVDSGELLHLRVSQDRADVLVEVLDPWGRRVAEVDSPEGWEDPESVVFAAAFAGTYRLRVRLAARYETATFVAEVVEQRRRGVADLVRLRAESLTLDAEAARRRGDLMEAAKAYEAALDLWTGMEDIHQVGHIRRRLGRFYHEYRDRPDLAIPQYSAALDAFRAVHHRAHEASTLWALGRAYSALQRWDEAAESYQLAWPQLIRRQHRAFVLNELGWIYQRWGELEESKRFFELAIEEWRQIGDGGELATALHNRGLVYLKLGRLDLAREDLEDSAMLRHDAGDTRGEAISATALGDLELSERSLETALSHYQEALRLYTKVDDPKGQAVALNNVGLVHRLHGRLRQAESAYRQALQRFRLLDDLREQANVLHNLSVLELSRNRLVESKGLIEEAWEIGQKLADAELRASISISEAELHWALGDIEQTADWVERASSLLEEVRAEPASSALRASLLSRKSRYFDLCVDFFMARAAEDQTFASKALECSLNGRARSLLDRIEHPRARWPESDPRSTRTAGILTALEQRATDFVEAHSGATSLPEGPLRNLLKRIEDLGVTRPDGISRPRSLVQIQAQLLDEDTGLLHYHLGSKNSFVWWVTADGINAYPLPPRAEIEITTRQLHQLLIDAKIKTRPKLVRSYIEELGNHLLGPVAQSIDRERVLISAHGLLQYVPFALLPDGRRSKSGAEPVPLIENHVLVMVPSASVALALGERPRRSRPGTLGAVADPVLGGSDDRVESVGVGLVPATWKGYQRLVHSRAELSQIARAFPEQSRQEYLDFEASLSPFLEGRFAEVETLHVVAHGRHRADSPGLSHLVLSLHDRQGRRQPGHLFAFRVETLQLTAELVVLSACGSGLGSEIDGEGLVGLPSAFFIAGARQVLVSLWNVSDAMTAELMGSFYRFGAAGLDPAGALRAAQLEQRSQRPRDWEWAAFVIQGVPERSGKDAGEKKYSRD